MLVESFLGGLPVSHIRDDEDPFAKDQRPETEELKTQAIDAEALATQTAREFLGVIAIAIATSVYLRSKGRQKAEQTAF